MVDGGTQYVPAYSLGEHRHHVCRRVDLVIALRLSGWALPPDAIKLPWQNWSIPGQDRSGCEDGKVLRHTWVLESTVGLLQCDCLH